MTLWVHDRRCGLCNGTTYYDDETKKLWCEGSREPCKPVETRTVNLAFGWRKVPLKVAKK
jgi:hypothetical protein